MSKISLHNVDIIMSYRGKTAERRENLDAVLRHFDRAHTDYSILLMESDEAPVFDWHALSDTKIKHVFSPNSGPFPKAFLYNLGAKISRQDILFFIDIDCIPNPEVLSSCILNMQTADHHDVLCPYYGAINIKGETKQKFLENPDYNSLSHINKSALTPDSSVLYETSMGGAIIIRRKDYIRIGGMDSSFIGWGGEDNEIFFRSQRLGLKWISMDTPLYHLHHDSDSRAEFNAKAQDNAIRAFSRTKMPIEEIEALTADLQQFFV